MQEFLSDTIGTVSVRIELVFFCFQTEMETVEVFIKTEEEDEKGAAHTIDSGRNTLREAS